MDIIKEMGHREKYDSKDLKKATIFAFIFLLFILFYMFGGTIIQKMRNKKNLLNYLKPKICKTAYEDIFNLIEDERKYAKIELIKEVFYIDKNEDVFVLDSSKLSSIRDELRKNQEIIFDVK